MKLYISKEDDRLTVAALLVKNGYMVRLGKESVKPGSRTYRYFVETVEQEETSNE